MSDIALCLTLPLLSPEETKATPPLVLLGFVTLKCPLAVMVYSPPAAVMALANIREYLFCNRVPARFLFCPIPSAYGRHRL